MTAQIIQFRAANTKARPVESETDPEVLLTLRLLRQIAVNLGLEPIPPQKPKRKGS
jgi:hypothetical protein